MRVADFDRKMLPVDIDESTLRAITGGERRPRLLEHGGLLRAGQLPQADLPR